MTKISVQGRDYIFFEITEPEELAFTYKVRNWNCKIHLQNIPRNWYLQNWLKNVCQANPASFTPPWNDTFNGIKLVATDPPCGCGFVLNADEVTPL